MILAPCIEPFYMLVYRKEKQIINIYWITIEED